MTRPLKLLLLASHPVQYASPVFRLLAKDPRVEIEVAYCSMQGTDAHVDPDFGVEVKWDVPLLDGYRWTELPNRSWRPGPGSFFGLINPRIWRLIRQGNFDAVVAYTGYAYATFWIALAAAKLSSTPILFGTDAHELSPRDRKSWKLPIKRFVWPLIFGRADVVIVPSSGGARLMKSLRIPEDRVAVTPYTVDNEWWTAESQKVDRAAVRQRWGIPEGAPIIVFSAKLQPWKRPADVLRAFAQLSNKNAYLLFAGDGPLRKSLEAEAPALGVSARVRFLGFVNQSGLPEVYTASDILVLPSDYEPFGVVVNEAMLCGCCVVASDRVGAGFDLLRNGETGFVYPFADIKALAGILFSLLDDRARLATARSNAATRMRTWSPRENVEALVAAVDCVCA